MNGRTLFRLYLFYYEGQQIQRFYGIEKLLKKNKVFIDEWIIKMVVYKNSREQVNDILQVKKVVDSVIEK